MARLVDRGRVTGPATPCGTGAASGHEIAISRPEDFTELGERWRELETRSNGSFFQSWTWMGCLVAERFADPVLVEAREQGRTVALALFNCVGRTLYLGESGDPAKDSVFIEYNGVLAETGREAAMTVACLRAARVWPGARPRFFRCPWRRRLVLNGVDAGTAALAEQIGFVRRNKSLPAPFVDFTAGNGCFLASRSANTRQQLRRSQRVYAASGPLSIDRADTLARAYEFLDGLMTLHQATWTGRRQPGAFANPFFGRFHRALIARGLDRREIDLLQISAGVQTVGFLYNFRYRGRSLAYQSGFDYAAATRQAKPGLTSHHEAIGFAAGWGAARYDFLAGDDRYKHSLSDRAETLYWIEIVNRWSPRSVARGFRNFAGGLHFGAA